LYSIYDPPVFSGLRFAEKLASFRPSVQKHLQRVFAFLFERDWKPFRIFERELGLPPAPNPLFWGHSPQLALGLFSPLLAAPQRDWPANAHATGFPFLDQHQGLSPELNRFLESGAPPIVFTRGSAAVGAAGDFFRQSAEAARRAGRRAVLVAGREPREAEKRLRDMIVVPYAPHAALFPRACAIVHQGGIGTTGEAMRAGKPMVVVPYSHDQPDQAARLTRLGVARSIPRERYDSRLAATEIQAVLEGSTYAVRATDIAFRVRRENGTASACDHLCRLLETSHSERDYHSQLARVVA
jgi:UDP:flavonoid glycosyltransferase YjiC (YdhE family)